MPHNDTTPLKHCPTCNIAKPATTEYFQRNKTKPDGFQTLCKVCRSARAKEYSAANKERIAERHRLYFQANKERAREQVRAYRKNHREEYNAWTRAYYAANGGLERQRLYKAANKDRIAQYQRVYVVVNKERVEKRVLAWRAANKEKMKAAKSRRRARELNAPGHHTRSDVKRQYGAQHGRCYYCNCELNGKYETDHVIPLCRGGSDGMENIVVACATCNRSKHDKLPSEWSQGGRLL